MGQRKVLVCGRQMVMLTDDAKKATPGANAPHTSYALDRPEIARELAAFRALISLPPLKGVCSVMEMFGGSGWHSAAIQDILKPKTHDVMDIAPSCVESIKLSLPEVSVSQGDSYAFARDGFGGKDHDLIHADFNQYTPMRGVKEKLYKGVLEQIFEHSTYSIVTDSAVYGVSRFERNRESYGRFFGKRIDNVEDYFTPPMNGTSTVGAASSSTSWSGATWRQRTCSRRVRSLTAASRSRPAFPKPKSAYWRIDV